MYWCLIPFREGSQRVKYKNIKLFNGRPLVWYTIRQALECFDESNIIAATDISYDTMKVLVPELHNTDILFHKRKTVKPSQKASTYIKEIIDAYPMRDSDSIVLLQPTCPTREPQDIQDAIQIYELYKRPTLVSVQEMADLDRTYLQMGDALGTKLLKYGFRMDNQKLYQRNSSIYIFNVGYFLETNTIFDETSALYVMPDYKSIDINTNLDFSIAELIYKRYKGDFKLKWDPEEGR